MAAAAPFPAELEEELTCSICLNIYKNPILLSCGHNFCKDCIEQLWESQAAMGTYSCPECRTKFRERPPLQKSLKLCNVIERLLSTQVVQKEDTVYCTFCMATPLPAIKTCLQCETSFCQVHLRKHNKSVDHTLVDPNSCLEGRKCPEHKEIIRYYCTDDAACLCVTCCLAGEHQKHNIKTVTEVAQKKKEKIDSSLLKLLHQTKDIEQTLQQLQEHLKSKDVAALAEREKIITLFSVIKRLLETAEKKTLDAIDTERKRVVNKTTNEITELEMKKDNILHKMEEMKVLRDISDPTDFLEESKHIAGEKDEDYRDENGGDGNDSDDSEEETEGLIKENLEEQTISLIKHTMNGLVEMLYVVQVKTGFILQDSTLLFDTNTAQSNVILSDCLKKATYSDDEQKYPENARRFLTFEQVMCSQSFSSGRHFWEFELSAEGDWSVGLAYNSIERDGDSSIIGENSVSWCLDYNDDGLKAIFDCDRMDLKMENEAPQKAGVSIIAV
nr:PREDICTED: E3 ubiquitin/ISG15 ligase TRIM25-like [Latimeria chalumnae]|eukprot:XP_006005590.2 PREDICTED: E3 ubiquitin/ISG15 ligase TRIM25-like [Latimeria chalumnae]